jgi:hypothetical protein
MSAKSLALLLVAALTAGSVAIGGGVRRYHARPRECCGIPAADYQPRNPPTVAGPVVAVSQLGAPLVVPTTAKAATGDSAMSLQIPSSALPPRPRARFYQFVPTTLALDHCSISRMALTIDERGHWRLNLRADQNPHVDLPSPGVSVPPQAQVRGLPDINIKHTEHLRRNQFIVRVRGYGAYAEPLPTPPTPTIQGKPLLTALGPFEFWVQRGVPYPAVFEGDHTDVLTYFDQIDRVEIELSYR